MFGLNPYLLGGTALAFVLSVSGAGIWGHWRGYDEAEARYKSEIAQMVVDAKEAQEADQRKREAAFMEASNNYEGDNAKAKVIYRTITRDVDKVVDRPVYRNVCLDDDGMRLANLALAGVAVAPADSGKSDTGMPRALAPQ